LGPSSEGRMERFGGTILELLIFVLGGRTGAFSFSRVLLTTEFGACLELFTPGLERAGFDLASGFEPCLSIVGFLGGIDGALGSLSSGGGIDALKLDPCFEVDRELTGLIDFVKVFFEGTLVCGGIEALKLDPCFEVDGKFVGGGETEFANRFLEGISGGALESSSGGGIDALKFDPCFEVDEKFVGGGETEFTNRLLEGISGGALESSSEGGGEIDVLKLDPVLETGGFEIKVFNGLFVDSCP